MQAVSVAGPYGPCPGLSLATLMTEASTKAKSRAPEAVVIDLDLCKACGICIAFCPADVFEGDDFGRPVVARLADCTLCAFCERHCPDFAIDIVRAGDKA
jgi:2-oxoglutarate ferredoxin oxidoreductase subunit delta